MALEGAKAWRVQLFPPVSGMAKLPDEAEDEGVKAKPLFSEAALPRGTPEDVKPLFPEGKPSVTELKPPMVVLL
jgi:hypothetical protein